jgi:hypothetical protein
MIICIYFFSYIQTHKDIMSYAYIKWAYIHVISNTQKYHATKEKTVSLCSIPFIAKYLTF